MRFDASPFSWPIALLIGVAAAASVRAQEPLREAPIIEPGTPADPPPLPAAPSGPPPSPQSVAQVFFDACVQNEGNANAVVDWALAQGFEAVDPLRFGAEDLLGGVPGTVLAMPGSEGHVLLAAAITRRCLVWAEHINGPKLRIAFQKMVGVAGNKGAKVQSVMDRNLNSAGMWRNQSQWRYRRVGGGEDYGLGSATTLGGGLSTQLLNFAPMGPPTPPNPDGTPNRR